MKRLKTARFILILLSFAIGFSTVFPEDAFARRGGFGGGRAFSSRSSSWGTKSRAKSAWSSQTSRKMKSQRGSIASGRSKAQMKTDKALYQKAKTQGTAFKNRADAKKSFSQGFGSQYGSKYAAKPAAKPDHIPATTKVDGRDYPVDYNPQYGGYGYFGPGRNWVAYSVMADVVVMNTLMRRHQYYYGAAPGVYYGSFGGFRTGLYVVIGIVIFAIFLRPR